MISLPISPLCHGFLSFFVINAYKLDLPSDYNVSANFNVANLSPFDFDVGDDSRMNQFKQGGMMQPS